MLSLVLFNIFIHNLHRVHKMSRSTGIPDLLRAVKCHANDNILQDLTKLNKRHTRHRSFSIDKCRVTHVEEDNPNQSSLMLMMELAIMAQERGLKLLLRVA